MDKATRNLLQRATQNARRLLEDEYREQLEGTFDILIDGTITPAPGAHLNAPQRLVREKLVAAIAHARAGGLRAHETVAGFLREAAFTTLNRFVALKMLEGRGLAQPCVSEGDQSSGFKEYTGLAPGLVALPDHGYRMYLESLFDEIGREVGILFDRRDPASLLWPRRQALTDLLEILNRSDIAAVWVEDETIGWVYQYFNGEDERKAMRDASPAPRDSRELAVRNQFFTPRYVVEFLTDNTLGRLWYEMRQGDTRLAAQCRYLVRRPTEIFLEKGQKPPHGVESDEDLSQEERLKRPHYLPFRAKKDPRDLKILDPACGSGHFLLYAFDLLATIYEEAWADADAPVSEETGGTLRADYPGLESLRAALPGLILERNLHGIDIDPRAAQIAALALWMRARRAYNALGVSRAARAPIRRTNIVVAEPMPGEDDLLREFTDTLRPKAIGDLVIKIFEKMKFAGEAGSLLKIEEEISEEVSKAKKLWEDEPLDLFPEHRRTGPEQTRLDFSDIPDARFWHKAEGRVIAELHRYARGINGGSGLRRRLFAGDAERGFAFVDICRTRLNGGFDVVLMNPPFGESSKPSKPYIERAYPRTRNDVYAAFVERGLRLLHPGGMLGAITSRTGFFLSSFQKWREEILLKEARPTVFADLGYGVLDSAMVETAAYCLEALPVAQMEGKRL